MAPGLTLIGSDYSHNFLSKRVSLAAELCVDQLNRLNIKLADDKQCASLDLAYRVQVTFTSGVV